MKLNFIASVFAAIHTDLIIGFSEGKDGEHYFFMQRDENYIKEALPNMKSIYIELDDQCWGGYGEIDWVTLSRNKFTILFNSLRATRIGYDKIEIILSLNDSDFQELRSVL